MAGETQYTDPGNDAQKKERARRLPSPTPAHHPPQTPTQLPKTAVGQRKNHVGTHRRASTANYAKQKYCRRRLEFAPRCFAFLVMCAARNHRHGAAVRKRGAAKNPDEGKTPRARPNARLSLCQLRFGDLPFTQKYLITETIFRRDTSRINQTTSAEFRGRHGSKFIYIFKYFIYKYIYLFNYVILYINRNKHIQIYIYKYKYIEIYIYKYIYMFYDT